MQVINQSRKTIVASNVKMANSFTSRFKGLMGRVNLPAGEALALRPCNSVHTCFMRFAIDIIFLDKEGFVLRYLESFVPWRLSPIVRRAVTVLELPEGSIQNSSIKEGDKLVFKN